MNDPAAPEPCPRCGCPLIWNGRVTSCMSCSYIVAQPKSEQKLPAAKSRKKGKTPGQP